MIDTSTKKKICAAVSADKISFKSDGTIVFRRSYYYRHGATAEGFGGRVKAALNLAGLAVQSIETTDAWATWPKPSYFVATVRLHQ